MSDRKIPNPNEIRQELENFAKEKFGGNVQFFAQDMPFAKRPEPEEAEPPLEEKKTFDWKFNSTPKQVKEYLDRYVIRQDEAKKALAIAVCDHYNHVRACHENPELTETSYAKQNVLMLGPTGVGKTYLIRHIAKLIGVPFVKADATRFTETGYVGSNVDDLIKDLVSQADGDIHKAQFGIIYLDEADKLATPRSQGRDVGGRGVQFGLLKIMEESEVDLRSGNDIASQMQALMDFQTKGKVEKRIINTRHILFIVSGAFTGLKDIISKRMDQNAIGITSEVVDADQKDDNFEFATTEDFVEFGFEPEFIGRLPVRVNCQNLSADDLFDILKDSEESIVHQYERSFKSYGINVTFEESALREIAARAEKEKTGARALMTVTEKVLRDFKFELPSTDIRDLVINKKLIEDPEGELEKLLKDASYSQSHVLRSHIRFFEREFAEKYQLEIQFDEKATDSIISQCENADIKINEFCEKLLQSYEHGLNLVKQNTGRTQFKLGADVVENPKTVLEKWIKESYQ